MFILLVQALSRHARVCDSNCSIWAQMVSYLLRNPGLHFT